MRRTESITHFAEAAQGVRAAAEMAARKIGQAAAEHARAVCPVDTGRLRASIGYAAEGGSAVIGTDTPYAVYVELGTARQRAQPYLVPALSEHTAEYAAMIRAAMGDSEGGTE